MFSIPFPSPTSRRCRWAPSILSVIALVCPGAAANANQADPNNVGVADIPNPAIYSQVAAISDVHGEYDAGVKLLARAGLVNGAGDWIGGKTLLVVTGDSIDKGPKSWEVLDLWMRLQKQSAVKGGRVLVLLGNHEAELLSELQTGVGDAKAAETIDSLKSHGMTLEQLGKDDNPMGKFLLSLPLAARVGNYLFCHAGWIPAPQDPSKPQSSWAAFETEARTTLDAGDYHSDLLQATNGILEKKKSEFDKAGKVRNWWKSKGDVAELLRRLQGYGLDGLVFGHRPEAFDTANEVGPYRSDGGPDFRLIKIDSGMGPDDPGLVPDGEDNAPPYTGHMLEFKVPSALDSAPPIGSPQAGLVDVGAVAGAKAF